MTITLFQIEAQVQNAMQMATPIEKAREWQEATVDLTSS